MGARSAALAHAAAECPPPYPRGTVRSLPPLPPVAGHGYASSLCLGVLRGAASCSLRRGDGRQRWRRAQRHWRTQQMGLGRSSPFLHSGDGCCSFSSAPRGCRSGRSAGAVSFFRRGGNCQSAAAPPHSSAQRMAVVTVLLPSSVRRALFIFSGHCRRASSFLCPAQLRDYEETPGRGDSYEETPGRGATRISQGAGDNKNKPGHRV